MSVILALTLTSGAAATVFADEGFEGYMIGEENTAPAVQGIAPIDFIKPLESETEEKAFTLTADKVTTKSARLTWESEELYLSYTLSRFNIISQSWEDVLTTSNKRVYLVGLSEDSDYKYAVKSSVDGKILGTTEFSTGIKRAAVSIKHRSSTAVELNIENVDKNVLVEVLRSDDGKTYEKIGVSEDRRTYTDETVEDAKDYYYTVKCSTLRNGKIHRSRRGTAAHVKTLMKFGMPTGETDGECKTFAYYTAVTARSTPQYQLLNSELCYTDEETGIRMVDGYYCVALGSYYGTKIGNKYRVTLQDGEEIKEINVILCDQKADRHTNPTHQYAMRNKDIVEFYIERAKRPAGIAGDYGVLPQFRGKVIAIEQYVDNLDEETVYVAKKEVENKDEAKAKKEAEAKKKEKEKKAKEKAKKKAEAKKKAKAKEKAKQKEKEKEKSKETTTEKKTERKETTTAAKEPETEKETETKKEVTTQPEPVTETE